MNGPAMRSSRHATHAQNRHRAIFLREGPVAPTKTATIATGRDHNPLHAAISIGAVRAISRCSCATEARPALAIAATSVIRKIADNWNWKGLDIARAKTVLRKQTNRRPLDTINSSAMSVFKSNLRGRPFISFTPSVASETLQESLLPIDSVH